MLAPSSSTGSPPITGSFVLGLALTGRHAFEHFDVLPDFSVAFGIASFRNTGLIFSSVLGNTSETVPSAQLRKNRFIFARSSCSRAKKSAAALSSARTVQLQVFSATAFGSVARPNNAAEASECHGRRRAVTI